MCVFLLFFSQVLQIIASASFIWERFMVKRKTIILQEQYPGLLAVITAPNIDMLMPPVNFKKLYQSVFFEPLKGSIKPLLCPVCRKKLNSSIEMKRVYYEDKWANVKSCCVFCHFELEFEFEIDYNVLCKPVCRYYEREYCVCICNKLHCTCSTLECINCRNRMVENVVFRV
jgi:hypothetical protein